MRSLKYLLACTAVLVIGGCDVDNRQSGNRLVDTGTSVEEALKSGLSISYSMAHVEVLDYNSVHLRPQESYDLQLRVTYSDGIERRRVLRLARNTDGGTSGIETTLFDESGDLVITATQRWGMTPDSTYMYYLHEATPDDYLTLEALTDGAAVTESYDFNGNSLTLSYVRGEESEEVAGQEFSEFYNQNALASAGTLDANDEGSMMVTLVNDSAFVDWVKLNIRPAQEWGPLAKPACDLDCFCYMTAACGMVACPFGAFANPACSACAAGAAG